MYICKLLLFKLLFFVILMSNFSFLEAQINVYKLLEKTREQHKLNSTDYLSSYQYFAYDKFYIDEFNYNFSSHIDSISLPDPKFDELYILGERISEHKFDKKYGKKSNIIANKLSGFKEPFYDIPDQIINQENYPDVLTKNFYLYNFYLTDSLLLNNRDTYVISFNSKKKLLINGSRGKLFIDKSSYALVHYSGIEYSDEFTRYFDYTWENYQSVWYLKNKINKFKLYSFDLSKFMKGINQKIIITPWIVVESTVHDFTDKNKFTKKDFSGYSYELDKNFDQDTESKISIYRKDSLTKRESNTYSSTHSLFDIFPIEKNMKMMNTLKKGEFSLGKINLDIENALSYNDFEGFRFQLGGRTNYNFNKNYSLYGYTALGTKNNNLKGGAGITFFINKQYDGKLKFKLASDVNPFSKNISRYPRSMNQIKDQLNFLQNPVFYDYRKAEISYEQDILKHFTTSINIDYQLQKSEFNYNYKTYKSTHWFNQLSTSLNIKYAPFATYMQTPEGKKVLDDKPIYFYLTYSKTWKIINSDFDYHKLDFSTDISFKNKWGLSNIFVNSGIIKGETTLWNSYGSFGNAKSGKNIFDRFSAKGVRSLETLPADNFFATQYFTVFLTHTFPDIKLWETKKISIAIVYNALLGRLEHKDIHAFTYLCVPDNYYHESGIEVNRLISNFGLGFYYRLGAYSEKEFSNNLYMKLTFNLFK